MLPQLRLSSFFRVLTLPDRWHPAVVFFSGGVVALGLAAAARSFTPRTLTLGAYVTAATLLGVSWVLSARLARKMLHNQRSLDQTSQVLARSRALQTCLAQINQAAAHSDDDQTFLETACRLACEQTGLALAAVVVPEQDTFAVRARFGRTAYLDHVQISPSSEHPEGHGPCGVVWRTGSAFLESDFEAPEMHLWREQAHALGLRACAALLLRHHDRPWGVLALFEGDEVVLDAPVRPLWVDLAGAVSRGLDTIERTQRMRLLDRAVNALTEGLTISDASKTILFVNPAFERMSGYTAQDVVGRPCGLLQSTLADNSTSQDLAQAMEDGHGFDGELLCARKDGTEFWSHLHLDVVRDARNAVTHYVAVCRDVTLQKQGLDLQHALLENSSAGVLVARDRRILAMNSALAAMVGQTPEWLCEQSPRTLYSTTHDYDRVETAYADLATLESTAVANVRLQHRDGRVVLCDLTGRLLPDGVTSVWTFSDVTERESRAQALRRAQRVYRALAASAQSLLLEQGEGPMLSRLCAQLLGGTEFASVWVACPDEHQVLRSVAFASQAQAPRAALQARTVSLDDASRASAQAWVLESTRLAQDHDTDPTATWVLAVPVRRAQTLWGVIEFRAHQADLFDPAMRQSCEQVSALLGHGLDELDRKTMLRAMQDAESLRARTDVLTGLPNRLAFEEYLPRAIERATRQNTSVAVGMIDLDDFKPVNDQYGHLVGDILLRKVAQALNVRLRTTDFLARIGGDEFVLVFEGLSAHHAPQELDAALQRLRAAVQDPYDLGEGRYATVGMTAGVALYPQDADQPHALLRMADTALYEGKDAKTTRSSWWRLVSPGTIALPLSPARSRALLPACAEPAQEVQETPALAAAQATPSHDYSSLLYGGGLQMWLQPVIDLQNAKVLKAEALARLVTPEGQVISPAQFLLTFSEDDLHALFRMGLTQALALLGQWQAQGIPCGVCVNLSPVTLAHPDCVAWIRQALASAPVDPQLLTLEVLETDDIDPVEADRVLHALHALGVGLALDDLGSGYSNLTRLASLPIDTAKIDQSLVRDLRRQPLKTLRLLSTIVGIGNDFAQTTVLEGLEDRGCIEVAQMLGAHLGQGYGLARPMPPAHFENWYHAWDGTELRGGLRTWLGALAYLWHMTRGLTDRAAPRGLAPCPLGDFLRHQGLENAPPMQWLLEARKTSGDSQSNATEALLQWLAEKASDESASDALSSP